jgi:hypothetical protein
VCKASCPLLQGYLGVDFNEARFCPEHWSLLAGTHVCRTTARQGAQHQALLPTSQLRSSAVGVWPAAVADQNVCRTQHARAHSTNGIAAKRCLCSSGVV